MFFEKLFKKLNFKTIKISGILLSEVKENFPSGDKCKDCGCKLRFGKDKNDYIQAYCQKCKKIIKTVAIPRFRPLINIEPDKD